ncbi:MAG: glycolate oxidase subunit GlcF [Alphaproteobacteria bacterium]|nr:glycolate oxidase subunit GlcF [Alphaproteobacteria bacterium]
MQTQFTPSQLAHPDIARADGILRKCVHCGFCTATCPTYVMTGDERDSPRGRIWLIRDMLENDDNDGEVTGHHLDRCLTCLSCTSTCPSGVDYMHLVDIGRRHADQRRQRRVFDRVQRKLLISILPYARRAYVALMLGWLARPLRFILPKSLAAMLAVTPKAMPRLDPVGSKDQVFNADTHPPKARVALLAGCAQRAINPDINAATIRLLNRIGVEVVVRKSAYCCGGVAQHTGDEVAAENAMASTIKAWANEKKYRRLDAVIINTSGCGTVVKDYADHFANDSTMAEDAAQMSAMAMDISEFLDRIGLGEVEIERTQGLSVAYHAACSLQHGQKIKSIPKDLLRKAGFEVRDIAESHLCCGSAGTYNALQPDLAQGLQARKLKAINDAEADIVAAGNLGCINQLADSNAPIVHTVQLLDWATGGPKPRELRSKI